ncbi:probable WRKY transcription factor protein 1 [Bombus bifarius]|uniref:Probable WRKY transcription factor protein 1 n=1 Tax=Bombus bifarius TaxID=103933 RepID=A0A6P8MIV2_9HYME|nr:probable WRKY transcription factor protein 1 [Bombus bifarius]
MHPPIFTWFLFLTFIATSYSKSININSEDIETLTTDRTSTTISGPSPIQDGTDSKDGNKRSLLILVPTTKGKENTECQNEKTRRCKTPFCREKVSARVPKEYALKSKNTENSPNNERDREYFVGLKPNLQLLSSKRPLTRPRLRPITIKEAKNLTFRDESLIDSLRKEFGLTAPTVGAAQENMTSKTSVYDDGKFICYCREKDNSSSEKGTSDVAPKPRRTKKPTITRKPNNENPLIGSVQRLKPTHANVPHRSPLSKKLPAAYPIVSRYSPIGYIPNNVNPISPQKGHGTIPYIPYVYHPNPRPSMTGIPSQERTPNINIPLKTFGNRPNSIVEQRTPIGQHDSNKYQPTVGQTQRPPNMVGNSLSRNTNPATSSKTFAEEDTSGSNEEDSNDPSYNSQSVQPESKNHLTSMGTIESSKKDPNLQATNPHTIDAIPTGFGDEFADGYETTDSGALDYSNIKEVTSVYFTSKAYDNETGDDGFSDYDDLISNTETAVNPNSGENRYYDVNLQSKHNDPTDNCRKSASAEMNLHTKDLNNAEDSDRGNDEGNVVGKDNPLWNQDESANDDSNENLESNVENTEEETRDDSNVNLQSRHNDPTENSGESEEDGLNLDTKYLNDANDPDQGNTEENVELGRNNPNWNEEEYAGDDPNQNLEPILENTEENEEDSEPKEPSLTEETRILNFGDSKNSNEADTSARIDDKDDPSKQRFSAEDSVSELPETNNNAGSLNNDYEMENVESNKSEERGEGRSPDEGFINTDNEKVGTERVTTENNKNEDDPSLQSTLESSRNNDDTIGINDPSKQLPFCDNTLLQKSIKTVINSFATGDSSEMDGNENEETVGSAKGEDLLPEIVQVPNLKSILSMPSIENTVLDKIKNLLSKVTGTDRKMFDSDWATNVIKNNLRHTLSAAPSSKAEFPPMTVEEHQFKNGKWVTNLVTLEPSNEEDHAQTNLQKLQAHVKNLLRDPAVGLQAAKNPAVQNMIVQSIRRSFKPKNVTDDENFDSIIQSTLNNEVSIMEMENEDMPTTKDIPESTTFDISNIDMNKLLDIAKSEVDVDDKKESESTLQSSIYEKGIENQETPSSMESSDKEMIGEAMNFGTEDATSYPITEIDQSAEESSQQNETPNNAEETEIEEFETTTLEEIPEVATYNSISTENWNVAATLGTQDKSLSTETEDYTPVEYDSPSMNPAENADVMHREAAESTERSMELENKSSTTALYDDDATSANDFTYYLGKITKKNENNADDVQSLQNSELFYIGDGVKLPLEIRKLHDGSYALSISRKICEQLLNKECPCCVPKNGNVLRTVKRNLETENADRTDGRIFKRESMKSVSLNERERCDSADDSLQIFSMPVETFARRYNLSLNSGKMQTAWNFGAEKKIDERSKNYKTNVDAKERGIKNNPHDDATNFDFERYRYQRNTNEDADKRVEIVTTVLNWLKDIVLNTNNRI